MRVEINPDYITPWNSKKPTIKIFAETSQERKQLAVIHRYCKLLRDNCIEAHGVGRPSPSRFKAYNIKNELDGCREIGDAMYYLPKEFREEAFSLMRDLEGKTEK